MGFFLISVNERARYRGIWTEIAREIVYISSVPDLDQFTGNGKAASKMMPLVRTLTVLLQDQYGNLNTSDKSNLDRLELNFTAIVVMIL